MNAGHLYLFRIKFGQWYGFEDKPGLPMGEWTKPCRELIHLAAQAEFRRDWEQNCQETADHKKMLAKMQNLGKM